ncbi:hypothetical protein P4S63_02155 [Pseudoalteromonas sp. B193]
MSYQLKRAATGASDITVSVNIPAVVLILLPKCYGHVVIKMAIFTCNRN